MAAAVIVLGVLNVYVGLALAQLHDELDELRRRVDELESSPPSYFTHLRR